MILMIDDEGDRIDNDIEWLRSSGYQVHLEQDVDQALKFLESHSPVIDGVICDIMIPHGRTFSGQQTRDGLRTGVSLFELVRAKWPDLPFIFFTNSINQPLRRRFQEERACAYLLKREHIGEQFIEEVRRLIPLKSGGGKN